jgi:hypothetical protein
MRLPCAAGLRSRLMCLSACLCVVTLQGSAVVCYLVGKEAHSLRAPTGGTPLDHACRDSVFVVPDTVSTLVLQTPWFVPLRCLWCGAFSVPESGGGGGMVGDPVPWRGCLGLLGVCVSGLAG